MQSVRILGIPIHSLTMAEALAHCVRYTKNGKPHLIVTPNAEIIYLASKNKHILELIMQADLRIADGSGLIWAARYNGTPLPERVTGIDLMSNLLADASKRGARVYFLGAYPDVIINAKRNAEKRWPGLNVCGIQDGYFTKEDEQDVIRKIVEAKPDLLFVGMGAPRQELWMVSNRDTLNIPLMMGVGGSFDVLSGHLSRAPLWMQKTGLEWLYRLYREPRRLKRMFALPLFIGAVVKHKYTG